tara:strand:+ start:4525 stop:5760 length:1236 start_codon:yes stop_codon:yes gene_type:complete
MGVSGTGFFDSFEPVDTSSEQGALNKTKMPKTIEPIPSKSHNLPTGMVGAENIATPQNPRTRPAAKSALGGKVQAAPLASPAPSKIVSKPSTSRTRSNNPAWQQIDAARGRASSSHKHILLGIAGPPKSGKSGMVLDSLTDQEKENGAEIHHIDFDAGGESTKAAHHSGSTNIVVLNPWVMNDKPSRVPYDFPATYQMTIDYLKAAIEQADYQTAYFEQHGKMPVPYLKTVCFDGADHWLNICETTMKVDDLQLGVDGIATAGKATTTQIGRFNWNIRKNRYNSALTALQELCRRGIHCYLITHLKSAYDGQGNEIVGADTPNWLKDTEGWLQQMAVVELEEERNERGELTGVTEASAILTQNRTSLKSYGRVKLFRKDLLGGVWYGWKGLRDGTFEHPDDVKDNGETSSE